MYECYFSLLCSLDGWRIWTPEGNKRDIFIWWCSSVGPGVGWDRQEWIPSLDDKLCGGGGNARHCYDDVCSCNTVMMLGECLLQVFIDCV